MLVAYVLISMDAIFKSFSWGVCNLRDMFFCEVKLSYVILILNRDKMVKQFYMFYFSSGQLFLDYL